MRSCVRARARGEAGEPAGGGMLQGLAGVAKVEGKGGSRASGSRDLPRSLKLATSRPRDVSCPPEAPGGQRLGADDVTWT